MSAYSPNQPKPLGAYAILTAGFHGAVGAYVLAHRRSGRTLPSKLPIGDFVLLAVGTHKLSRLISKDRVTSFLRSPFTRYQEDAGPAEVSEEPRGTGLQLAIGELIVCPYCLGQWVAAAFVGSYVAWPDVTRMAATVFAVLAASDVMQQAWVALDRRA